VLKKMANIAYLREDAPGEHKWNRIGGIFYDPDKDRCRIVLYAWRQGISIARPAEDGAPPLSGDIVFPSGEKDGVTFYQKVGWITSTEDGAYSIHLEAAPIVPYQAPCGVWLDVQLETV